MPVLPIAAVLFLVHTLPSQMIRVSTWNVAEVSVSTDHKYADPFTDLDVDAVVTDPKGESFRVPAFWAGEGIWRFRYSSGLAGIHRFRVTSSDSSNPQLNGVAGQIEVSPYAGDDPLFQHGPIKVAKDHRHFEASDGTPFLWLGDTWWKGLSKRIDLDGFRELSTDRKRKGFSVVQIVAGPYPDEPPFDPRWENEAGAPYEAGYRSVNPAYFDAADKKIRQLVDSGLVPAIVGGWGWHMPKVGVVAFIRHWRYLIARYAAFPVVWIVAGEGGGEEWTKVAQAVRTMDPFHRLITMHTFNSARRSVTDESVLDFDMLQTGHNDWDAAPGTVARMTASVSRKPTMPVVDGEVTYEGHMMSNREDIQRFMFWSCMLNGAAGHTYGAGGLWQMNSDTVRGSEYEFTPWRRAMDLPGSTELGLGKKLFEEYPWWSFAPHPEWVDPHSSTLFEPHSGLYDDDAKWHEAGGRYDLPYAAGIPGKVRFIYIPGGHPYNWSSPIVRGLEENVPYHAFYFDPALGNRWDLGILEEPTMDGNALTDLFGPGPTLPWKDFGALTSRTGGRLVAPKNTISVVNGPGITDAIASVGANGDAEAGLVFRFHNADDYVVGLYTPSLHAIYFHDRKGGQWGEMLGKTAIPNLGPHIRLTAAVCGDAATLTVTDGTQSISTPTVKLENLAAGMVGLWHYQIGDSQEFDHFRMAKTRLDPVSLKSKYPPLVLRENPGLLPAVPIPSISLVLDGQYRPARLPSPQDWVLVLERLGG